MQMDTQNMNSSPVHTYYWRWEKMLFMVWDEVLYGVLTQWSAGIIPAMNISIWFPEWNWPLVHTEIQTQGQPQICYHNMFTAAQVFSMQSTLGTCQWFDSLCPVYLNFLILQSNNCCQVLTDCNDKTDTGKADQDYEQLLQNACAKGAPPMLPAPTLCLHTAGLSQTTSGSKLQGADFFLGGKIWGKSWPTGYMIILI